MNTDTGSGLAGKNVTSVPIRSFSEWKSFWDKETDVDRLWALLERLKDPQYWPRGTCEYETFDVAVFLLETADGHRLHTNFGQSDVSRWKRRLALKALEVLCEMVLSPKSRFYQSHYERQGWLCELDKSFRESMLHFFRFNKFRRLHNLPLDHLESDSVPPEHTILLRETLSSFVKIGWAFDRLGAEEKSVLRVHALQVFELRGDLLASAVGKELDEACETHLKARVLAERLELPNREGVPFDRYPADLEEGVLGGSEAAQLLSLWEISKKTRNQIMGIGQTHLVFEPTSG